MTTVPPDDDRQGDTSDTGSSPEYPATHSAAALHPSLILIIDQALDLARFTILTKSWVPYTRFVGILILILAGILIIIG